MPLSAQATTLSNADTSSLADTSSTAGIRQELSSYAHLPTTTSVGSSDPNDPFYLPPETIPTAPGSVIRTQSISTDLGLGSSHLANSVTKMLYTSTDVNGRAMAVSGFVVEPANPWQGEGPTPTVVIAPGTFGAGDTCATSKMPALLGIFTIDEGNPNFVPNYLMPFQLAMLDAGMRVVVTDYAGLGTPGAHTYAMHTEEGRAVLDAARAGLSMAGQPADSPVAFWGFSQGGGASAAAAEMVADYAPELNVKGTFAAAPPSDLLQVIDVVDGSALSGVSMYSILGFSDRFPRFKEKIDSYLNDLGKAYLAREAENCSLDTMAVSGFIRSEELTTTGESLAEIAARDKELAAFFEQESLGKSAAHGPVLLATIASDDIIPAEQVYAYGRQLCSLGSEVEMAEAPLPSLTSSVPMGADHLVGGNIQSVYSITWLRDRFNGVPVTNTCGQF
ncbi:Secretory lipase [Corynebacterium uterequi]|uniref:Secretory lipase n=2 Tax=Corynebacterium uterequi TaxID=1072256 RepID=A0A0G3HL76_9CORY|nr:Secretory lipase [Corynebacterium uterequi]